MPIHDLAHDKVGLVRMLTGPYKFQQKIQNRIRSLRSRRIWTTILFTLWEVEVQNQSGPLSLSEKKNHPQADSGEAKAKMFLKLYYAFLKLTSTRHAYMIGILHIMRKDDS
jgi:hypothetical protein